MKHSERAFTPTRETQSWTQSVASQGRRPLASLEADLRALIVRGVLALGLTASREERSPLDDLLAAAGPAGT